MAPKGRGGGRPPGPRENPAEAAYRRFLNQQKDGLRAWAQKRAALLDEVGMSTDMEQLVVDLLEDLRALVLLSCVELGRRLSLGRPALVDGAPTSA